jgi:2-iminobutanoate/2-iminopropanoate deaminase
VSGRRPIATDRAPRAIGPYAQAVAVGDTLYVSGQIGLEPATGELVRGGVAAEAERVLENLGAVVEAAGFARADVVKTVIYLVDLADFDAVNQVYARHFASPYPARATVAVAALPKGARIEIEAVAVRSRMA